MKVKQISAMVLGVFTVVGVASAVVAPSAGATSNLSSTSASQCVDLNVSSNVKVHWADTANKPGTVTVSSNGLPACADTTLWFSSFTLPKNYDNSGVFGADHPTSFPQKGFAHTKISVKAGQVLNGTYTVSQPDVCQAAAQYDVYARDTAVSYIPDAKGVMQSGTKWAWGFVVKKLDSTDAACKVETPKTPTPTTPKTPTPTPPAKTTEAPVPTVVKQAAAEAPAAQPAQTVSELPHTGLETIFAPVLGAGAVAAAAAYAVRRFRK